MEQCCARKILPQHCSSCQIITFLLCLKERKINIPKDLCKFIFTKKCKTCFDTDTDFKCKSCNNVFCLDCLHSLCQLCNKCTDCTEEGQSMYPSYEHDHSLSSNVLWYICQECRPKMNFEDDYKERRNCKLCAIGK